MPRAGLNRERIAQQAAAVADETGLDRLTLAAVAARCGVSLPGLYKHVDGFEAVKRDIAVLAVRELSAELAQAAAGLAGRDALVALSHAYRGYARAHPGRYAASVRAPAPGDDEHAAAAAAALGLLAAVLKGYRIEGADMIDAVRMLRAALHGFVAMEAAGGFGLPQSVDGSFARLVDALHTAWSTWAAPAVLPAELAEPVVVNAEMVGDLVDDGAADLGRDLLLGVADRADRLPEDGDAVGQHPGVLGRAAGERDALVEPEQAGRASAVLDRHRDVAHQLAEFLGQPVQRRDDHVLETAGVDLDHQPIVQRGRGTARASRSPAALTSGRARYPGAGHAAGVRALTPCLS